MSSLTIYHTPATVFHEREAKATDENQTGENWEIFLTVWEKVNEDGEAGARNCVNALQKRLAHRNANVQLFSLSLADSLISNCEAPLHREICGKSFTSALVRLVNDRNTHDGVKKRILTLVKGWVKDHGKNPDFDLMLEIYEQLKAQNHKFDDDRPKSPEGPSDDVLRREEEDLQRALAESAALADPMKGFKRSEPQSSSSGRYDYGQRDSQRKALPQEPAYGPSSPVEGGFVPPSSSSVIRDPSSQPDPNARPSTASQHKPSRVRALYDFETETPEELPLKKGDIVKVIKCDWDAWWFGELKGRQGIFPTSYVEEIPEPPPSSLAQEAEMEAQLFAQSGSIDNLLNMMRSIDPASEDLAQNEDLLELYQQNMALRPRVVKLLDKYNKKQMELRAIHDKFDHAKSTYEKILAESQTRYNPEPVYAYPQQRPQQGWGGPAQQQQPQQQQQQHLDPNVLAQMSEPDRIVTTLRNKDSLVPKARRHKPDNLRTTPSSSTPRTFRRNPQLRRKSIARRPTARTRTLTLNPRLEAWIRATPSTTPLKPLKPPNSNNSSPAHPSRTLPKPSTRTPPSGTLNVVNGNIRSKLNTPTRTQQHLTPTLVSNKVHPPPTRTPCPTLPCHLNKLLIPPNRPFTNSNKVLLRLKGSYRRYQLVDQMQALSMAPSSQPVPVASPPNVGGGYTSPVPGAAPNGGPTPHQQPLPQDPRAHTHSPSVHSQSSIPAVTALGPHEYQPVAATQDPAAAAAAAQPPMDPAAQADLQAQWAAYYANQAAYAAQNPGMAAGGGGAEQAPQPQAQGGFPHQQYAAVQGRSDSLAPEARRPDRRGSGTGKAPAACVRPLVLLRLGPVLLGDCLQLILFGILVSAVFSYLNSGSYARTSKFSQVIVAAVVLLATLSTMLDVGDIWYFGTLQTRTEGSLLSGTLIESCEPLLVGVIGALVETVLVMFVERRNMIIFVVASGIVILVGLVGAIGTMV
ncbi:hypothetical protein RQP46_011224 [Phenoliferia psychrophenolica]